MACGLFFLFAFALFSLASIPFSVSQLSPTFYDKLCPQALPTIRRVVEDAVLRESRMGASLLRLHFHDCFVNGCDGSLLLDPAPGIDSEKNALPNLNTARGFEVVDRIKSEVDKVCGRPVVSCADILAVAARDSVVALGGPTWKAQLGRKDSTTANRTRANEDLPSPFLDKPGLISAFRKQGLDAKDLVLLSAAHTVGLAQCQFFRERIYNETNIDPTFAAIRRTTCPRTGGNSNLAPFDVSTPVVFDNGYFRNLVSRRGLLHSDQVLFNGGAGGQTDELVRTYSVNPAAFSKDFGDSMIKMGNIKPPKGSARGEVRLNCRKVNSPTISLHAEDLGGNFHSQI